MERRMTDVGALELNFNARPAANARQANALA